MKRMIRCGVLLIMMLLLLCGCGKSEAALAVEQLITDIGEVNGDSDAAICQAEDAYDKLSQKDKEDVENYSALVDARNEYDGQKAKVVIELIDSININDNTALAMLDSAAAELEKLTDNQRALVTNADMLRELREQFVAIHIEPVIKQIDEAANVDFTAAQLPDGAEARLSEAQTAYSKMPQDLRDLVTNADKLTVALDELSTYHVSAVEKQIESIGTVTLDSEEAVASAEAAYDGLTAEEKQKVSNYDTLVQARRTLMTATLTVEAEAKKSDGQYKEVCELLQKADGAYMTDELKAILEECQDLYITSVLDTAAGLAANGDYDGAIAAITEGQKLVDSPEMSDKRNEYTMKKMEADQLVTVVRTSVKESFIYNQATVVVKNQSDKVIKEYKVAMVMLDSSGYPVNNSYSFDNFQGYKNVHGGKADSANIQPGKTFGEGYYWLIEGSCDKILACVVSAEFYDGTTWENPYLEQWLNLYAEKPVL